jgi:Flp pilus assembly protein TadD
MSADDTASVLAVLANARCARSDPATAERAVTEAVALAPDDVEARLAAYRFYFYSHRLADALPHAAGIVVQMARRLNVATDWRLVRPEDAEFSGFEEAPSLYLQALLAWGYGSVRLGQTDEGCRALEKVVELDPRDRFGARRLLGVVAAGEEVEGN